MSTARIIGLIVSGLMVPFCGWIVWLGLSYAMSYWEVQRYHAVQFPVDLSVRQTFSGPLNCRYYGFADQLRIELDPPIKTESEVESLLKPLRLRLRLQQSDGYDCFNRVIEYKQFNNEGIALLSSGQEESLAGCESTYSLKPLTPYVNIIVPGARPAEYTLFLEVLEPSPDLAGRKQVLSCYTVYCMTEVGVGILFGEGFFVAGLVGLVISIVVFSVLFLRGRRILKSIQSELCNQNPPIDSLNPGNTAESNKPVE